MNNLYDEQSARFLLGCIFNEPTILATGKFPISQEDFEPCLFHKILFKVSYNLMNAGANEIDEIMVNEYLKNYEAQLEVCKDNQFMEFVRAIKVMTLTQNKEVFFNKVRKFTILRKYESVGWDISSIYDQTTEDITILDSMDIDDIFDFFEKKQVEFKRNYSINNHTEEMWAGEGFDDQLDEFEEDPMFGANLSCPYQNSLARGWIRGHLFLRSSNSGGGKTTSVIGDLCNVGAKMKWDEKLEKYVDNPSYCGGTTCYIHTEQKMKEEIQPRFISWISGFPYDKIMDGDFTKEEKKRLSEAGKILKDSKIKLINAPLFTISYLKETIKDVSLNHNCHYLAFDYIWDNSVAGKEHKAERGTDMNQTMLILAIADALKICAEKYNVGIMTMIQTNGKEKINEIIDEACLFGSTIIKSKLDYGEILLAPRKRELIEAQAIIDKYCYSLKGNIPEPNRIRHVFKARYSKYGQLIKIWQYLDMSTGRSESYFCTDVYNQPIKIDKLIIKNK